MPLRRLPPLHALRAFEACARLLSFKDAADELSVTPGAISQQIKALEADLDVTLFNRLPRTVTLTEAGHLLYPRVADSFRYLREAVDLVRPSKRKTFRISTMASIIVIWLMPRMQRFSDLHPDIETSIDANVSLNPQHEDGPDVEIHYGHPPPDTHYARKLFDEFLMPLASPQLLRNLDIRKPQDITRARLLSEGGLTLLQGRSEWEMWFAKAGLPMLETAHFLRFNGWAGDFVVHAAIEGNGIALGRAFLAHRALSEGRLVCPFGPTLETGTAYYVTCRKGREKEQHIRSFMDWLDAEAAILSTLKALKDAMG